MGFLGSFVSSLFSGGASSGAAAAAAVGGAAVGFGAASLFGGDQNSGGATPVAAPIGNNPHPFDSPTIPQLQGSTGQQFIPQEDITALSQFNSPDVIRQLLSRQRSPGGFLAPGQQQTDFGIEARGIVGQLAGQRRDLLGDLRGLNQSFAGRSSTTLDFNALRDILSARARAESASTERNFLADQGFANTLASTDVAQKQQVLQALQFNSDISSQLKSARVGARAATTGSLIGGGLGAVGLIGAALV